MKETPHTPRIDEPEKSGAVSEHEEIARIAYFIWLSEGRPDGDAEEHWRQAEMLHIGARLICADELN
jgi:hypothetical protein